MNSETFKTAVVVGFGNIGSQFLPLLAHAREIGRLVLVDPDVYDPGNLWGQNIRAADVGCAKVTAMARLIAEIREDIEVMTHACTVEDVPLGCLRADLLVSCVDSRRARQAINRIAWRLDIPWVDAAVQADSSLLRVAVYLPGPQLPCLECRWDRDDYDLLEPVYACDGSKVADNPANPSTGAGVELGGLVAAFQAMAVRRLLAGDGKFAGQELFVNAARHGLFTARFGFNPSCLFDHRSFHVRNEGGDGVRGERRLSERSRLGTLLETYRPRRLSVEGHSFVFEAVCQACAVLQAVTPDLERRLTLPRCSRCNGEQVPVGQSMREALTLADQSPDHRLADFGLRDGDVVMLHDPLIPDSNGSIHLELGRAS